MRIATRYSVRRMTVNDIPQVLEVERQSFPTMWPPTAFKRELQQNRLANYIVVVEHNDTAEEPDEGVEIRTEGHFERLFGEIRQFLSGREERPLLPPEQRRELIVGFIGVWMLPDEAHIVTVAVRDGYRRHGIGEMLLISAIELAREQDQSLVTLEVRVSNTAAIELYRKYGFEEVGLRPRYYSDNKEDAYVLTAHSVLSDRYALLFQRLVEQHRSRWGHFLIDL